MNRTDFEKLSKERVLLLDGATGSYLYDKGMPRGICTELWIKENPDIAVELMKQYVSAGSDIILAPTFGANRFALQRHGQGDCTAAVNDLLVSFAKEAAEGNALIAGDLSPSGMNLKSRGGDYEIEDVFSVYQEQIECLVKAGVDLLFAETLVSLEETMVLLDAAQTVCDLPVMCSFSVTADGRAYVDGTLTEAVEVLQEMGAAAIGINCCSGPDQIESLVRHMKSISKIPVIAKPNAGLPVIDEQGHAIYSMSSDAFAVHMKTVVSAGADIIGGCCGTSPEYIRKMKLMLDGVPLIC